MKAMGKQRHRCRMTEINPLAGVILGSIQQQRVLEVEKTRQLRRARTLEKNIAAEDDELENAEQVKAMSDEDGQEHPPARRDTGKKPGEEKPHIDIRG
jgi:hypothetical protein